jgi:hypothetical protein
MKVTATLKSNSRIAHTQLEESRVCTGASFISANREEKYCIKIPVAFRLYLVKIIQILTN